VADHLDSFMPYLYKNYDSYAYFRHVIVAGFAIALWPARAKLNP